MGAETAAHRLREMAQSHGGRRRGRPGSVQGYVRAHLDVIREVRDRLTWDEIAQAFAKDGLTWGNGKPVSGKDLRTLFCRLGGGREEPGSIPAAIRASARSDQDPLPMAIAPGTTSPAPNTGRKMMDTGPNAQERRDRDDEMRPVEPAMPAAVNPPVQVSARGRNAPASGNADRERILREMQRASAERNRNASV